MKSIQKPGLQLLNTVFFNKYRLVEKLGEGTFGMIFKCESTDGLCAFKFEKKRYGRRSLLKAESEVMMELKGFGIPKIISYIENDDYNIMIMELLGKSLEVLAQQYADEKLSVKIYGVYKANGVPSTIIPTLPSRSFEAKTSGLSVLPTVEKKEVMLLSRKGTKQP